MNEMLTSLDVAGVAGDWMRLAGGVAIGFVCGSIPFGYLLVRLRTGADVRDTGSGNIGATNVSRAMGVKGGAITLLLDAAKGALGVIAAAYIGTSLLHLPAPGWAAGGAFGAVLGHCYTPWLKLRGGKGVATHIGAFGVLAPAATLVGVATLVVLLAVARMMSLASLAAAAAVTVASLWLATTPYTAAAAALAAALIVWRHRDNIARIARGEERKLGEAEV